tara:strand:- start:371 stop:637 length:267 start_codon:yes stop_codon:yes gene_type:complete
MSGALSQDFATASPPKISRELICPNAPHRPVAFSPILITDKDEKVYKAKFPTTCTWKRLGLKKIKQDVEAEHRQKKQKTKNGNAEIDT